MKLERKLERYAEGSWNAALLDTSLLEIRK